MFRPVRHWYVERYIDHQLHGDPVFAHRIREEGSNRVIAKDIVKNEAEMIVALANAQIKEFVRDF